MTERLSSHFRRVGTWKDASREENRDKVKVVEDVKSD